MKTSVISCSLNPYSRSYVLATTVTDILKGLKVDTPLYDLRKYNLSFCGSPDARENGDVSKLKSAIEESAAVVLAMPIYNFDVNAAAKNLIELTGRSWTNTLVGFLCAAGGQSSYMSVMSIANSLMLDFRCIIVPRFVYAVPEAFLNDRTDQMQVGSEDISRRLHEFAATTAALARAISPVLDESN
jgi:FMN reductase